MKPSQIDAAVLALVRPSWTKVSMLLVKTVEELGMSLPNTDEGLEVIASRIAALVHDGQLEAQGDLNKWRFSEVRLPNKNMSDDDLMGA